MIVGWRPGGTIDSKRVELKPEETLPNAYNHPDVEVWRQDPENGYRPTTLVKGVGYVLPSNSKVLTSPVLTLEDAIAEVAETLPLIKTEECATVYEHVDIITIDEGEKE